MNADAFRHFYNYHLAENRKIWDSYIIPLTQEQFTQPLAYSKGSIHNQVVHLMNVDAAWFSDLKGLEIQENAFPEDIDDRDKIRQNWDKVEQSMRDYLTKLRDDMLFEKPLKSEEDKNLIAWQVLLHVVNHGTDHRAQLLRQLNDLGVKTGPQDYIFYVYDHP